MLVSPYSVREVESELKVSEAKGKGLNINSNKMICLHSTYYCDSASKKAPQSLDMTKKGEFDKHKEDWRLDDVTLNDTETGRLAAEFACTNATAITVSMITSDDHNNAEENC